MSATANILSNHQLHGRLQLQTVLMLFQGIAMTIQPRFHVWAASILNTEHWLYMWPNLHKPTLWHKMLFLIIRQYTQGITTWLIFHFYYKWNLLHVGKLPASTLPMLGFPQVKQYQLAAIVNEVNMWWCLHHCHGNQTPWWRYRQLTASAATCMSRL